mmetsp:Transcript_4173/g.11493  ORF Transcript_4173/g.11493 Transcript_4173/m.11493 type:complete len:211 (-) Transcript_4173:1207-1839(-)
MTASTNFPVVHNTQYLTCSRKAPPAHPLRHCFLLFQYSSHCHGRSQQSHNGQTHCHNDDGSISARSEWSGRRDRRSCRRHLRSLLALRGRRGRDLGRRCGGQSGWRPRRTRRGPRRGLPGRFPRPGGRLVARRRTRRGRDGGLARRNARGRPGRSGGGNERRSGRPKVGDLGETIFPPPRMGARALAIVEIEFAVAASPVLVGGDDAVGE